MADDPVQDVFGSTSFPEGENPFAVTDEIEASAEPEGAEAPQPQPVEEEPPAQPKGEKEETPEPEAQPEGEEPEKEPEASATDDLPTTAQAVEELLAGKYKNVDELINAHRHQEAWTTRTRQENITLQQELEQYKAAVARVIPYLQAQQQQQAQPAEDLDLADPEVRQAYIQREIQEGIQRQLTPMQQQRLQAQQAAEHRAKQERSFTWQQDNPDVQQGTPLWTAMNNVIYDMQYDSDEGQLVEEQFPITPQNLTIAKTLATDGTVYEMAQRLQFIPSDDRDIQLLRDAVANPNLADELEAVPDLLTSSKGHEVARRRAGLPAVVSQAQAAASEQQKAQAEAERKAAHVTDDTAGAPAQAAPGQRPDDAWEAIGGPLWEKERSSLI